MRRRDFLRSTAFFAAIASLGVPRRARAASPRKLLVVWNGGGWDPTFVFDPHVVDGLAPEGMGYSNVPSSCLPCGLWKT